MKYLVLIIFAALTAIPANAQKKSIPADEYVLIDLVVLNEGYSQKDRDAYNEEIQVFAKDYGADLRQSYKVAQKLAGAGPNGVTEFNLWSLKSPDALAGLSADENYKAIVPKRDKIHNMDKLTLFLARPKPGYNSFKPKAGKFYLLDYVIMTEGNGLLQRTIYTKQIETIAAKFGVQKIASFDVLQHLGGLIPGVLEVNVWEMDSPESMQALGNDPVYQKIIPFRDQIHDMQKLTLYMAQAK